MTDQQIIDTCRTHGAKAVSDAAYAAMEGRRVALVALGLGDLQGLAVLHRATSLAYALMSDDDQAADLKAGRGMGLALAAELNGYPGPSHVLELADRLELSIEQKNRIQQLFDSMRVEAVQLGTALLAQEAALDTAFASRSITPESLSSAMNQIGVTQAGLVGNL